MRLASRMKSAALSVALLTAMTAGTDAKAGDVLHFKSGRVSTKKVEKFDSATFFDVRGGTPAPRYYVVQYETRVMRAQHDQLKALGAKVLRYVPDDALIVEASPSVIERLATKTTGVRTVLPLRAQWKLSPDLEPASVFSANNREQIFIRLFDASKLSTITSAIQATGGKIEAAKDRSVVAVLNRAQIERVAMLEGIEWIQPAPKMELAMFRPFDQPPRESQPPTPAPAPPAKPTPGEPPPQAPQPTPAPTPPPPDGDYSDLTGFESGTKIMNFDAAWRRGYKGRGQKIAFADTGFDRGEVETVHDDFKGRLSGAAYGMFASRWEDPVGHGTHVGGSVGGDGAASGGRIVGAAPEASLLAQGLWSPLIGNLTVPPKLADLMIPAYAEGARIHTNSWGSPRDPGAYESFAAQADEIMFNNPDLLLVFAAGNGGMDMDRDGRIDPMSVTAPGTAKNVMTVGSSENVLSKGGMQKQLGELRVGKEIWGRDPLASDTLSNNANGIAAFSSRGPTSDGRVKPDVVAPGTNILSARSYHPDADDMWGRYSKDYVFSGGTSMATPLVAGAAALVRQYLIEGRQFRNPSAALIKNILMHTSVDLFPGQFGLIGAKAGQELLQKRPNTDQGFGRVDVDRATALDHSLLFDEKVGVASNETMKFPLRTSRSGKVIVSLVWTDAPASPSAQKALVNDLDLAIVDSLGREIASRDRVNNFEVIERSLSPGDYEIVVRGVNVPHGKGGKQPFSLVVSLE